MEPFSGQASCETLMNTEERHGILSQERGSAQGHAYRVGYLPTILAGNDDGAKYGVMDRSESLSQNRCPVAGTHYGTPGNMDEMLQSHGHQA
ncbi:hypothetical protein llap_11082 [Limosa lapponica baueri]|uniref:Uncharacterized protein n=1 Tax=Limosa lapponica baueri TaxID=1758121 RepID=A0A2I0TXS6_LIMLA|nr:hypothetical protein llap_11082 [Limosa lapponica baueri]